MNKAVRLLVLIAANAIVTASLAFPRPGGIQAAAKPSPPWQNTDEAVAFAKREMLNPVVKSLRYAAAGDAELNELLDHLQIWALPHPRPEVGPNAFATTVDGKPMIYVDLAFLRQLSGAADACAVALSGTATHEIMKKIGFDYGVAFRKAVTAGLPPPPFTFNVSDYVSGPAVPLVEEVGNECFLSSVTWTILHEVGHHRLGHLNKVVQSNAEARQLELAADAWAFARMAELGYSLAPVDAMLLSLMIPQMLRIVAGLEPMEDDSDHPVFDTRRKQLEAQFDVTRPPAGPWRAYVYVTGGPGKWQTSELAVPLGAEMYLAVSRDSEGKTALLPFERTGGALHLYGRDASTLQEFIIQHPDDQISEVTLRETSLAGHNTSETKSHVVQLDYSFYADDTGVGSITTRQIGKLSPLQELIKPLHAVENRPEVLRIAERILEDGLQNGKTETLRYARGEISYATANQENQAHWRNANEQLRALLGGDAYRRFHEQFVTSPFVQLALPGLPSFMSQLAGSTSGPAAVPAGTGEEQSQQQPPPEFPQTGEHRLQLAASQNAPAAGDAQATEEEVVDRAWRAYGDHDMAAFRSILQEGVNRGYPKCMRILAEYYDSEKDYSQAFLLYLRASLAGNVESMMPLSIYYLAGKGVQEDDEKGVFWVATAAKLGDDASIQTCRDHGIDYSSAQYGLTPENLRKHGYATK